MVDKKSSLSENLTYALSGMPTNLSTIIAYARLPSPVAITPHNLQSVVAIAIENEALTTRWLLLITFPPPPSTLLTALPRPRPRHCISQAD